MADTHEFQFPGGSAVITTTTGGTRDSPDFCVSGPDPLDGTFDGDAASVFAAEILKLASKIQELEGERAALATIDRCAFCPGELPRDLCPPVGTFRICDGCVTKLMQINRAPCCESCGLPAVGQSLDDIPLCGQCGAGLESDHLTEQVRELESALAAAGEERENMEIRLSGRIAELEAENRALNDMVRARQDTIQRLSEVPRETDAAEEPAFAVCGEHGYCSLPAGHAGSHDYPWSKMNERDIARHGVTDMDAPDKPNLEISITAREISKQPFADAASDKAEIEVLRHELGLYREELELAGCNARPDKISFIEGERKRLEEELTAASALVKQIDADRTRLIMRCRTATAENAALLEILRSLEWIGPDANAEASAIWCPECGNLKDEGHTEDCRLGRALEGKAVHQDTELLEAENAALKREVEYYNEQVNRLRAVESTNATLRRLVDMASREIDRLAGKAANPVYVHQEGVFRTPEFDLGERIRKGIFDDVEDEKTVESSTVSGTVSKEAAQQTAREIAEEMAEPHAWSPNALSAFPEERAAFAREFERCHQTKKPVETEPGVVVAASPGSFAAEYAAKEGMQDFRTPEFETEKLRIKKIRERAVADLREGMQAAPWFAGLSMEEVHAALMSGKVGRLDGEGVSVPEGFMEWLLKAHQQPGPEKPEEPRFKPLGVGGPGAWEARRRRHDAPNTISVRLTAEAERGVLGTDDLGLRGSEETIAVYGEREIIGFLETIARLRRENRLLHGASEEPHGE